MIQSVAQDFGLGLRDGLYRNWLAVKQFLRLMSVAQRFLPPCGPLRNAPPRAAAPRIQVSS
jgi:hypothetical protein